MLLFNLIFPSYELKILNIKVFRFITCSYSTKISTQMNILHYLKVMAQPHLNCSWSFLKKRSASRKFFLD